MDSTSREKAGLETTDVLLVEDSPTAQEAVRLALEGTPGYRLRQAGTLEQAVDIINRHRVDAVLLDLFLPDSEGAATVVRIQDVAPWLPLVVLTAEDQDTLADIALEIGAEDFIGKDRLETGTLTRALRYAIQRKRIHFALEQSDERFRDFAEAASDWFWEMDENLRFTYVSGRFHKLHGLDPQMILGKTRREWAEAGDLDDAWQAHLEDLEAHRPFQDFQYAKQAPDGTLYHFSVSGVPVFDHAGRFRGYRGVGRDITDRVQAEQWMARSSEFQKIFNHILRLSLEDRPLDQLLEEILDAVTSTPFLSLESKACIFTAEDSRPVLRLAAQRNLHPRVLEDCATVPFGECVCGRAAAEKRPVFCNQVDDDHKVFAGRMAPHGHYCVPIIDEERVRGVLNVYVKAGHDRDDEEEWFLEAVAGTLATILKRKQAEAEVRRNHLLLDTVSRVQSMFIEDGEPIKVFSTLLDDILSLTDSPWGLIGEFETDADGHMGLRCYAVTDIAWNESSRELFEAGHENGFRFGNLDNLLGAVLVEDGPVITDDPAAHPRAGGLPEGHPPLESFIGLPLYRGREIVGQIGLANRPGGYDAGLAEELKPLVSAAAQIIAAYRTQRARDEAEAALARSAEELRRSNADLEEFAYIASHDLLEPLRTIASYLGLLRKRYWDRLDDDGREFIGYAIDGGERLQQLVRDLLTYSRAGRNTAPSEPVDMDRAAQTAVSALQAAIDEAQARVDLEPLPIVRGDEAQLTSVLQNLIGNAIKYRDPERPPEITVSAERGDGEWVFAIQDNGIGLPERYAEKVFKIFQRLHGRSRYSGTGIGLAVCRKIIERHGGRIWVRSREEDGSVFYFTLPLHGA